MYKDSVSVCLLESEFYIKLCYNITASSVSDKFVSVANIVILPNGVSHCKYFAFTKKKLLKADLKIKLRMNNFFLIHSQSFYIAFFLF